MKLTNQEAQDILWLENSDWEAVPETEGITDHGRWDVGKCQVFKHTPTDKSYMFYWSEGATESQDYNQFEMNGYDEEYVDFREVELKEVLVEQWVDVA